MTPPAVDFFDPTNGDELRTLHSRHQDDFEKVGIISAEGMLKFSATWRRYSIDEPQTWPRDGIKRAILIDATAYDDQGLPRPVHGPHLQIDRLVDQYRDDARARSDDVPFEFVDERAGKVAR